MRNTFLYLVLTTLMGLPQLGCVERPYGTSNTTTAPKRYVSDFAATYDSNTTYARSNTTSPRDFGNTTRPYRPSSTTTHPLPPRSDNTTNPPIPRGDNTTFPPAPGGGNTTFPRSEKPAVPPIPQPQGDNTTFPKKPSARPQRNTTFPITFNLPRRQPESIDRSRASYLAQPDESLSQVDPRDWWYWRGPEFNGISRETGLIDDFDPAGGEGSNVRWVRNDIGGRSTPVTLRGRLYTLTRDKPGEPEEGEKVVCLDLSTGETLWENRFNVWLSDVPKERIGWSSVVADPETGNVYANGVCGYFQCIDGETGETIWDVPLHERFGFLSTFGGRTNFPIICEDLVIVSGVVIGWGEMAKPCHRFLAFNKHTGEVVWFNGTRIPPDDTTYSAPTITVLNGQKALVCGAGDGQIWAFQARTGKPIWNYDFSRRGLNVAPLVVGDTVFSGHSEENIAGVRMGAVVSIDATGKGNITKTGENWKIVELMMGKSSPIVVGDRLYCVDDRAKLYVLDTKSGEELGFVRLGTVMRASLLYADGKIYAMENNGRYYILQPDEKQGATILSRGRFDGEVNASPICSHDKIIVQTSDALYCLEDPNKEHGINPRPEQAEENPGDANPTPAHVQVVPAEVLIKPGEQQQFTVRSFNSQGQFLGESEAQFSLDGLGTIDDSGNFVAAQGEAAHHKAVIVTASVGDLTGQARMRVVPELPWSFTFEDLTEPPITWVGARYRHVIREMDGSKVMVKITTIPKGTRSRAWFGPTDLHDYTIQADVKGAITGGKMPDIGLIAQGYCIDLKGAEQKLQIRRWVAELKMAEEIEFSWQPDTWYTMKLQASLEDGKAMLRGKVWPRGEEEPAEWTLEADDPTPNDSGSPGLYGNAKDAELYLDNITVTPNA